jgi:hypothetical protein
VSAEDVKGSAWRVPRYKIHDFFAPFITSEAVSTELKALNDKVAKLQLATSASAGSKLARFNKVCQRTSVARITTLTQYAGERQACYETVYSRAQHRWVLASQRFDSQGNNGVKHDWDLCTHLIIFRLIFVSTRRPSTTKTASGTLRWLISQTSTKSPVSFAHTSKRGAAT